MSEEDDLEAIETAQAFKPKRGPLAIAMTANVVLAAVCLGVPYWRGHAQARASLHAFSRFAGCCSAARRRPGSASACRPATAITSRDRCCTARPTGRSAASQDLHAIAPEDAVFLWPSVKLAGGDVRTVVALVERELQALSRQRQMQAAGHVPSRPLLALGKLRAALALFAQATNADVELDADAVRFPKPAPIADARALADHGRHERGAAGLGGRRRPARGRARRPRHLVAERDRRQARSPAHEAHEPGAHRAARRATSR